MKELEWGVGCMGWGGGIMNLMRSQHTWEYLSRHSLRVSLKMFKLACIMNRLEEFSTLRAAPRENSGTNQGAGDFIRTNQRTLCNLGAWLSSFTTCAEKSVMVDKLSLM